MLSFEGGLLITISQDINVLFSSSEVSVDPLKKYETKHIISIINNKNTLYLVFKIYTSDIYFNCTFFVAIEHGKT